VPITRELLWTLQIGSGVFWGLTYLLIVRRGFLDRRCGMPLAALAANLSWEFIFVFVLPHGGLQIYINAVCLLIDLIILYQAIRFEIPRFRRLLGSWTYVATFVGLATAFGAVLTITLEFDDRHGRYVAFGQNLMMSILFVSMLFRRKGVRGQSMYIAVFKMLGTLLPSVLFYVLYPQSPLMIYLFASILLYDWAYIVLLYRKLKEGGIAPWRRA